MSSWCRTIESPVIFDIGANNGFIATQLAQLLRDKNPRVYAFEPVPSTFVQLELTVELLRLRDLVFPICRAVSDSNGTVRISYNPSQSLFAQVRNDTLNPRVGNCSVESTTTTVDEMIDSLRAKPSLMKVDVEGFEPCVFKGATRLLTGNDPPALCFEWNPLTMSEVNGAPAEIAQSLASYRLHYIDDFEGQRRPLGTRISDLTEINWVCNVFAVPTSGGVEHWSNARGRAMQTIVSMQGSNTR